MTLPAWDEEISPQRRDELIDNLARKVVKHGMSAPAILFLEMHKPFAFLASQTLILGSGFLAPLVGVQNVQEYSKLIESRDNVELLIRKIETQSNPQYSNSEPENPVNKQSFRE